MATRPVMMGERIKRREDPRLIQGLGTYTDDIKLFGMLYAAFVRSDYPAGEIRRIDTSRALQRKGVVAAYTFDDLRGRVPAAPGSGTPLTAEIQHTLLADGRVRYVGQPIAVVIANDRYTAADGARDVEVDIDASPAVVDPERALEPDAPRVYEHMDSNLALEIPAPSEDADRLFSEADGTVSLRLINQRVAPVPMEPRAVLAHWEEGPRKLTVWTSTQIPHGVKHQLAISLELPETRVRVVAPEVGGGFGCKLPVYPEEVLLPWISRELRKPVKWAESRTENLANTTHGRGHVDTVEAAYRSDGTVTALRGRTVAEVGAYPSAFGPDVPGFTFTLICGCYRIQAVDWTIQCVFTNTMATDAYRGAGRPEAAYIIERVMNAVARKLEVDPAEIRKRNFIPPDAFPYETPSGAVYDSGDYEIAHARALERFDYAKERADQATARAEGRLVGIGVASFTEICGLGPSASEDAPAPLARAGLWESAEVRVEPTGEVAIMTGASPHGQGQETAFAQMAAHVFGVDIDDVVVLHGDTDIVTAGVGTFGSRGLAVGGSAVWRSLEKVRDKATRIAAHLLDTTPDRVELQDGEFRVQGSDRSMSFREVAQRAHVWTVYVPDEEPGLEAVTRFQPESTTYPFSTHVCRVEVDPETGRVELQRYVAVDDVGNVVNPLLADGQRLGGIIQGIGQALYEEVRYDESGQLLTGTLMDYTMPKAPFFPRIELDTTCTPTPLNPLGAKGIGELGTIGSTPCVVGAVLDALAPLGVEHLDMPLHPEKVWRAIAGARANAEARS